MVSYRPPLLCAPKCRKQYDAMWQFGWKNRCPNFIPTKKEREQLNLDNTTFKVITNPAQTNHRRFTKYESLAELWSSFNEEYLYSDAPRLIIRAEDTFFFPKQLMEIISNCSGMPLKRHGEGEGGFRYFGPNLTKDGTVRTPYKQQWQIRQQTHLPYRRYRHRPHPPLR